MTDVRWKAYNECMDDLMDHNAVSACMKYADEEVKKADDAEKARKSAPKLWSFSREEDSKQTPKQCVFTCHQNAFRMRQFCHDFDWIEIHREECLQKCFKIDTDIPCKNLVKFSDQCRLFFSLKEDIERQVGKK